MEIPRVYFAGRVSKNCYRTAFGGGRVMSEGYKKYEYEGKPFVYWGPFAISCDHGCFHVGLHGMRSLVNECGGTFEDVDGTVWTMDREKPFTKREIIQRCYQQIKTCDIFYAYIDSEGCYGTLLETGHALAMGKPVFVVARRGEFETSIEYGGTKNELWFLLDDARVCSSESEDPLELLDFALSKRGGRWLG